MANEVEVGLVSIQAGQGTLHAVGSRVHNVSRGNTSSDDWQYLVEESQCSFEVLVYL